MTWQEWAAAFTIGGVLTTALNLLLTKVYGMGQGKAQLEDRVKKEVAEDLSEIAKNECEELIRSHTVQMADALASYREHMHLQEKAFLEYKAYAAEHFMPQAEYNAVMVDFKLELRNQFGDLNKRFGRLEDLVLNIRGNQS